VLPRGAAGLIARELGPERGACCVEVEPGDSVRFGDVTVTAVPAAHDRRRGPWTSVTGHPLGYRLDAGLSAWFAGDTDLYDDLASAVGQVDLALVPVGGWGPNLGPGHLDPVRAAEAVRRVGARTAVPVHFGTFWPIGLDWLRPELFHRPGERFFEAMAGNGVRVCLLAPGESTRVGALEA
jgi:L-ascorbate metabolism protein UlaG (beta-lactamase superfamily)